MPPVPLDRLGRVSSNHQRKRGEEAAIAEAAVSIVDHLQPLDSGRVWGNWETFFFDPPCFIVVCRRCFWIFSCWCDCGWVGHSGVQGFNTSGLVMGPLGYWQTANVKLLWLNQMMFFDPPYVNVPTCPIPSHPNPSPSHDDINKYWRDGFGRFFDFDISLPGKVLCPGYGGTIPYRTECGSEIPYPYPVQGWLLIDHWSVIFLWLIIIKLFILFFYDKW